MNRLELAKGLVKIAKKLAAYDTEYLVVKIPSGNIFHETDFDINDFEDKVTGILKEEDMDSLLVSSRMQAHFWIMTWEVGAAADVANVMDAIKRLPEWRLLGKYGAKILV